MHTAPEDSLNAAPRTPYPALFVGAGTPFLLSEESDLSRMIERVGAMLREGWGEPAAILAVSGRWASSATSVDASAQHRPRSEVPAFEFYTESVSYRAPGAPGLADYLARESGVSIVHDRGLDTALYPVLARLFPAANVPVLPMSVVPALGMRAAYEWGMELRALREAGILLLGVGNVGFNGPLVDVLSTSGNAAIEGFASKMVEAVALRDDVAVLEYAALEAAPVAMPEVAPLLPLATVLGAAAGGRAQVFNHRVDMEALAMTSFLFAEAGE